MLIFNCTQAAADFFTRVHKGKKVTPVQNPPFARIEEDAAAMSRDGIDAAQADQWLLHATVIRRKHVLVAIHVDTRYMMFFSDMKKADVDAFLNDFCQRWIQGMLTLAMRDGVLDWIEMPTAGEQFMAFTSQYVMFKRGERSAQGHINEALWIYQDIAHASGCLPPNEFAVVNFDNDMNATPRTSKALKGKYFYPEEEMLACWLQKFCGVADAGVAKFREQRLALLRQRYSSAV
ncbi:hypothetical protein D9M71_374300 [compost metagenome]